MPTLTPIIAHVLIQSGVFYLLAKYLKGAEIKNFIHAILAAVVFGVLGLAVSYVLGSIATALNFVTLGLFGILIALALFVTSFISNIVVLRITDKFLSGLEIKSWWDTAIFAFGLSAINTVLGWFF